MTHRENLINRFKMEFFNWSIGAISAYVVIASLLHFFGSKLIAVPIGFLLFAVIYTNSRIKFKCLKCDYGYDGIKRWRIKYGNRKKMINYCPHCGLGLDSDIP
jgi:hypothetical protein